MVTRIIRLRPTASGFSGVAVVMFLTVCIWAAPVRAEEPSPSEEQASGVLIAPVTICYPQLNSHAPVALQEQAMSCMVNYARERAGLAPVIRDAALDWSADHKAWDIIRCRALIAAFDYAHYACERPVAYWVVRSGYGAGAEWDMAENIAWGPKPEDTVRSRFRELMASPHHRPYILSLLFTDLGLALRFTHYDGPRKAVWVQHFGRIR